VSVHDHSAGDASGIVLLFGLPFALAALLYCGGVGVQLRSGRRWPWHRTLSWLTGAAAAAFAFVGPLVSAPQGFVPHMWWHLLAGMLTPVLLVIARPVTLALRSLHVRRARQVSRVLRSRLVGFLVSPAVATLLNLGGMWALYRTDLYEWMQVSLLLHLAVMAHVLFAGVLFTVAVIPFDPSPHRASFPTRLLVLVAALAAHNVLAKLIYASPPDGVHVVDGRTGALIMYYGGDVVDAALFTILCAQWYRQAGRPSRVLIRPARRRRHPPSSSAAHDDRHGREDDGILTVFSSSKP
jgi:putative membrane protein